MKWLFLKAFEIIEKLLLFNIVFENYPHRQLNIGIIFFKGLGKDKKDREKYNKKKIKELFSIYLVFS